MRSRVLLSLGAFALAAGCSWERFDELGEDPPVLGLETPPRMADDFGTTLASLPAGDRTSILVGNAPKTSGAATFLLGQDERATAAADSSDYCPVSNASRTCVLAAQPASLQSALSPSGRTRANCYVTGVGRAVSDVGLWTRCEDTAEFAIPVPADILAEVVEPALAGSLTYEVALASEPTVESALVAGVGELGRAFYYEPASIEPLDLLPTSDPPSGFGATVAVLGLESARVLVVGAPSSAELHFFRTSDAGPIHLGCVAGPDGLGRSLAAGDFDADGDADLVVSDDTDVRVLSGRSLGELAQAEDGGCGLDLDALALATFSCENSGDARDCSGSRFGAAVGIADFDGDGTAEVAVGAPRMTVRGIEDAGAVLIFDRAGDIVDVRTVSTAKVGDQFGARLAIVPQRGRDILAATAPGAGSASVVYCATIAGSGSSPRCP